MRAERRHLRFIGLDDRSENCNARPFGERLQLLGRPMSREQCLSTVADQIPQTAAGQKALRLKIPNRSLL